MVQFLNAIGEKLIYSSKVSYVCSGNNSIYEKPSSREGAIMYFYTKHPRFRKCLIVHGGVGSKVYANLNILQFDNYRWHTVKNEAKRNELDINLFYHTSVKFKGLLV